MNLLEEARARIAELEERRRKDKLAGDIADDKIRTLYGERNDARQRLANLEEAMRETSRIATNRHGTDMIDALRKRIAELEAKNERLREDEREQTRHTLELASKRTAERLDRTFLHTPRRLRVAREEGYRQGLEAAYAIASDFGNHECGEMSRERWAALQVRAEIRKLIEEGEE